MTVRIAEVVTWADLRDTGVASLGAGVGLTAAYGFVLLGTVRAREYYDQGHMGQAAVYGLAAVAGLVFTVTGITLGLIFIAD